jgi:PBP1b-binding outer membrane lipoprotein LpoB
MQTAWQQTVQNFMANSKDSSGNPPTSLSQVSQPSIATLKTNLEDLVNKMLGRQGANYKNIATYIGDPTQKLYAEKVVTDIDKFVDAIYNATLNNTDPKAMTNLFTELVGKGVLIAQNLMAYDAGGRGGAGTRAGAAQLSPQAQRMVDQADIPDESLAILQKLGANPANHDALLQMIGVKK